MAYSSPVFNPAVPYTGPIQGGLFNGRTIFVQGFIPPGCNRFSINLQCGNSSDCDIALHFNPRFEGTNQIVRNSRTQGNWGNEDRSGHWPFQWGQQFEVIILVQDDCYKIAINGQHYTEFRHRTSKEMVNFLNIEGNISITCIKIEGMAPPSHFSPPPSYQPAYQPSVPGYMPSPAAPSPAMSYPGAAQPPIYNPPTPFNGVIPGGMLPNKMIFISGAPNSGASRFNVNLRCGSQGDHALHFDVRFNYGSDRAVIVRNTEQHGSWGKEERHIPHFPFVPNTNFDMIIKCEPHSFKIAINNQHFVEYKHRVHPVTKINTLDIGGDIRLNQIRFQ